MSNHGYRRGFSSPGFEQGKKSEYDIATEAMANALERHLRPYEGNLRPVNWTGAAMVALAAAEEAVTEFRKQTDAER
jgi:hypothetical protein